ncbi:hypothetical protein Tco_0304804 [Tanacetum coccineum]
MEEDLAALFGDDDFKDDASDGFDEEEVWEVNEDWLMAPTTPPLMLAVPSPSVYEVGGPSTAAAKGSSFPHSVSGLPVPPSVIEDLSTRLGQRVFAIEGQVQVIASQMVHAADRWEQVGAQADVQQRDTQIQQLQTTVTEMGSRESTLMRCILGLEKRIAALERRPPRPQ